MPPADRSNSSLGCPQEANNHLDLDARSGRTETSNMLRSGHLPTGRRVTRTTIGVSLLLEVLDLLGADLLGSSPLRDKSRRWVVLLQE